MDTLAVTIPILVLVAAGYLAKRSGIATEEARNLLNKLVYFLAFPAMTFRSIVSYDFASTFRIRLVALNVLTTFTVFLVTFFLAFLIRDRYKRGAFNMGNFRSNQGYMGLPIVEGFYGTAAMSRAAVINGFDSALVIFLSVISLEIFRGGGLRGDASGEDGAASKPAVAVFGERFLGFITNPFVLSALGGIVLSYFKIRILDIKVIDVLLEKTGDMAFPLALISIGCSIEIKHLKSNFRLVLAASAGKLVFTPVVAFVLGSLLFGFGKTDLGMSTILLSTPTSVSSYAMACEMNSDRELMAAIIGFNTFLSVLTITGMQFIIKHYL